MIGQIVIWTVSIIVAISAIIGAVVVVGGVLAGIYDFLNTVFAKVHSAFGIVVGKDLVKAYHPYFLTVYPNGIMTLSIRILNQIACVNVGKDLYDSIKEGNRVLVNIKYGRSGKVYVTKVLKKVVV